MTEITDPATSRPDKNDPTGIAAKGKAALSDTQEVPAANVRAPRPNDDDFDDYDDFDDDDELARRFDARTRRKARLITGALALVATLGVGFASGVIYQKHQGSSSTPSATSGIAALRAALGGGGSGRSSAFGSGGGGGGAGGFAGFGGFGGLGSTSLVGTVSATANGTLYVSEGSSSALVKVVTGPTSTVTVSQSSSVSSIQPGDTVTISGAKQKDGSFMATSIRDNGSSSAATSSTAGG